MKPDIVVDVGNSRIKWGRCQDGRVQEMSSLDADDSAAWGSQLLFWKLTDNVRWAVAGVQPKNRARLARWIQDRGDQVSVIDTSAELPLRVQVEAPDKVGIDRLLNAVAANARVQRTASKVIIDAGTAVTVDWVDESGIFRGGAILPGLHLQALALHRHTALLPLVEPKAQPRLPGANTQQAIEAGIYWAVAGGIKALVGQLLQHTQSERHHETFLTGGDAGLLASAMDADVVLWPEMTLEGIRIAAEAQP